MSDEPKQLTSVADALRLAAEKLKASGISQASREAKSLLAFVLRKDKIFLVAHSEYELSAAEEKQFQTVLQRRTRREPFQYIVGRQEFCRLDFLVTKDVLIPRPETEMLVEAAIEILKSGAKFCEVGIGSGCIGVSILHKLQTASAIGLDISEKALKIAEKNAKSHQVLKRLELKISDVFESLDDEKFDLIVSNPPYISNKEMKTLQPEVRIFEPHAALTDGANGFSIIEKIIDSAPKFLKEGGFLLMEIGFGQAGEVRKMLDRKVWREVEIAPDLQKIPRMIKARIQ